MTAAAALGYAALLFVLSEMTQVPTAGLQRLIEESDKLLHAGAYSVFGFLLAAAIAGPRPITERRFWCAVALGSLYGLFDEFHQKFVPLRTPSGWDVLADSVGAWIGATAFRWWREEA